MSVQGGKRSRWMAVWTEEAGQETDEFIKQTMGEQIILLQIHISYFVINTLWLLLW